MNQGKDERKDRTGGDVTKADEVSAPVVQATHWDLMNQKAEGGK